MQTQTPSPDVPAAIANLMRQIGRLAGNGLSAGMGGLNRSLNKRIAPKTEDVRWTAELERALDASSPMTPNQLTVSRYMDGFRKTDHEQILSCLTDDVVWDIPGAFHVEGKAAFDGQIEGEGFTGHPVITVARMIEADDVVVAEGTVRARRTDGTEFDLAMCDVFEMRGGKIKRLISYLIPV